MTEKKLSAAIEETMSAHQPDASYPQGYEDGFRAAIGWMMRQPLKERLTDAEKRHVAFAYDFWVDRPLYNSQSVSYCVSSAAKSILTQIFGQELCESQIYKLMSTTNE